MTYQENNQEESLFLTHNMIGYSPELSLHFGVVGALLIQQIHYWSAVNNTASNGYKWVYNTFEEWHKQLGCFDIKTIKSTMKKLREAGVVVAENHNKIKYDRTLWYRVDYSSLKNLVGDILSPLPRKIANSLQYAGLVPVKKEPSMQVKTDSHPTNTKVPNIVPFKNPNSVLSQGTNLNQPIPKNNSKNNNKEYLHFPNVNGVEKSSFIKDSGKDEEVGIVEIQNGSVVALVQEDCMKAEEMMKNKSWEVKKNKIPAKPAKVGKSGVVTVTDLMKVFREGLASNPDYKGVVPEFSVKQKGWLSTLNKRWGSYSISILQCVVNDWTGFVKKAQTLSGAYNLPLVPDVYFLLRYSNEAHVFYQEKLQASQKSVQLIAQKEQLAALTPQVSLEKEEPISLEEIAKLVPELMPKELLPKK